MPWQQGDFAWHHAESGAAGSTANDWLSYRLGREARQNIVNTAAEVDVDWVARMLVEYQQGACCARVECLLRRAGDLGKGSVGKAFLTIERDTG